MKMKRRGAEHTNIQMNQSNDAYNNIIHSFINISFSIFCLTCCLLLNVVYVCAPHCIKFDFFFLLFCFVYLCAFRSHGVFKCNVMSSYQHLMRMRMRMCFNRIKIKRTKRIIISTRVENNEGRFFFSFLLLKKYKKIQFFMHFLCCLVLFYLNLPSKISSFLNFFFHSIFFY